MTDFRHLFKLTDIWRKTHGRQRQCTWFNADKSIGTRLDKFFISQILVAHSKQCEILPCVFSDHDSVFLELDLHDIYTHGPGVWR